MLSTWTGCLALVIGFTVAIDPYWLFNSPRVKGLNVYKPAVGLTSLTLKPLHLKWDRPENLIIGSSSIEMGINPDYVPWDSGRGYNIAYGGGTLVMSLETLETAITLRAPSQILLGLDFVRFHGDRPEFQTDQNDWKPVSRKTWFGNSQWLIDELSVTLSADAVAASIDTIHRQQEQDSASVQPINQILRNGMRDPDYMRTMVEPFTSQDRLFREALKDRMKAGWFPEPCRTWRFRDASGREPGFEIYHRMLALAYKNRIRAVLVVPPIHATMLVALLDTGIYPDYEEWKRRLVRINAAEADAHGRVAFPMYDFGVAAPETAEDIPEDSRDWTETFFDPEHVHASVGDKMIDTMYRAKAPNTAGNWGARLTDANLEEHLTASRNTLLGLPLLASWRARFVEPGVLEHREWIRQQPAGCEQGR